MSRRRPIFGMPFVRLRALSPLAQHVYLPGMDVVFALYVLVLLAHIGAHAACVWAVFAASGSSVGGDAATPERHRWASRLGAAAVAALVPPLAPFQAWRLGHRRAAIFWGATFVLYGAVLALVA